MAGDRFVLGAVEFELVALPAARRDHPSTAVDGSLLAPLHMVGSFDAIEIRRRSSATLTFGGLGARILCELIAIGGPVSWRSMARELWPDSYGEVELRRKWDASLARLRRKLRSHGVRGDLIIADGSGCVRLYLCEGDIAVDDG